MFRTAGLAWISSEMAPLKPFSYDLRFSLSKIERKKILPADESVRSLTRSLCLLSDDLGVIKS